VSYASWFGGVLRDVRCSSAMTKLELAKAGLPRNLLVQDGVELSMIELHIDEVLCHSHHIQARAKLFGHVIHSIAATFMSSHGRLTTESSICQVTPTP
jgi:hypothetical protein